MLFSHQHPVSSQIPPRVPNPNPACRTVTPSLPHVHTPTLFFCVGPPSSQSVSNALCLTDILLCNRALAFLKLGLPARALDDAETAVLLAPSNAKAAYRVVQAYLDLGRLHQAGAALESADETAQNGGANSFSKMSNHLRAELGKRVLRRAGRAWLAKQAAAAEATAAEPVAALAGSSVGFPIEAGLSTVRVFLDVLMRSRLPQVAASWRGQDWESQHDWELLFWRARWGGVARMAALRQLESSVVGRELLPKWTAAVAAQRNLAEGVEGAAEQGAVFDRDYNNWQPANWPNQFELDPARRAVYVVGKFLCPMGNGRQGKRDQAASLLCDVCMYVCVCVCGTGPRTGEFRGLRRAIQRQRRRAEHCLPWLGRCQRGFLAAVTVLPLACRLSGGPRLRVAVGVHSR